MREAARDQARGVGVRGSVGGGLCIAVSAAMEQVWEGLVEVRKVRKVS